MSWLAFMTVATAMECDSIQWRVINDTVMGGRSSSSMSCEKGASHFYGQLSLENNGGFTSVRGRMPEMDAALQALRIKVRGDGRSYIATLRTGQRMIYHRQPFDTVAGEELWIELPLNAYRPYAYGRQLADVPPIWVSGEQPRSLGFMLSDKQPGAFSLHIDEIVVVEGRAPAPVLSREHRQMLLDAIDKGVPLYNQGLIRPCAQLYVSRLQEIQLELADPWLEEALMMPKSANNGQSKAWLARHIMDQLLAQ